MGLMQLWARGCKFFFYSFFLGEPFLDPELFLPPSTLLPLNARNGKEWWWLIYIFLELSSRLYIGISGRWLFLAGEDIALKKKWMFWRMGRVLRS